MEACGGKASDGTKPLLDILPTGLHVRSPVFMGSAEDVDDVTGIIAKHAEEKKG